MPVHHAVAAHHSVVAVPTPASMGEGNLNIACKIQTQAGLIRVRTYPFMHSCIVLQHP